MVCYWYIIYLFILDIVGFEIYIWGRFRANYSLPYIKTPISFWYKRVSNLSPIFKEKKKKNITDEYNKIQVHNEKNLQLGRALVPSCPNK